MATEPEAYQPEVLAEEEPRYLRRQKPFEIRRRKFSRQSWQLYKRVLAGGAVVLVAGFLLFEIAQFLLYSPRMILSRAEQIEITGNRYADRAAVREKFAADRGHSLLRVPLAERRKAIEEIPWIEQASVERILPNRIRVELVERTPVAFLRLGKDLTLVDAHGVILERPEQGEFRFPVATGIAEAMPRDARAQRMKLYVQFLREIELVRPGATEHVSEVDLSDDRDLRATLAGLPDALRGAGDPGAVLVHFGDGDFVNKYRLLVENISQWRATAGRVDSVDLRFARQVVVNPENKTTAARAALRPEAAGKAR
ncbi:MAG: FtsQ-type POTRA domain-containing protein [Acidobacteria bacterium]|nr:FtsQ-type POTRA domain-containing protein [Acidobacteriota bacterium]